MARRRKVQRDPRSGAPNIGIKLSARAPQASATTMTQGLKYGNFLDPHRAISSGAVRHPVAVMAEQLEALYRQESEDKLNDAMADVLALCRERWQQFKRTTRRDVVQHCDGFKDKDRKALRYLRSLEAKELLESKAETTENGTEISFKPTE